MSEQATMAPVETFWRRIFGKCQNTHYVSIWSLPSRASRFIPVKDSHYVAEFVGALDEKGEDVYFGVCPHGSRPVEGRGTKGTVSSVPALWIDIDLDHPTAHKAGAVPGSLPPDDDAVADLLLSIEGLPVPSLMVHSGYGLHLYWTLTEPAGPLAGAAAVRALQAVVKQAAEARGWHIDSTHDLARVLRLPGSHNRKVEGATPEVRILLDSGEDHELVAFDALAARARVLATTETVDRAAVEAAKDHGRDEASALLIDEVRARLGKVRGEGSAQLIKKLLKGNSIANAGSRDQAMQRVCSIVGFMAPHNDPAGLVDLFRPMLTEWAAEDGAKLTLDEEIDKACDKIERAQTDKRKKDAVELAEAEAFRAVTIAEARTPNAPPGSPVKSTAYTPEELTTWAAEMAIDVSTLARRWIIQQGDACYVFVDGSYAKPIHVKNLLPSVVRDLAPAPVDLRIITKQGSRAKSSIELVSEYGQIARATSAEMGLVASHYDGTTQTFHEAVAQLRPIVPQFHPEIDEWLRKIGEPHGDSEKLLDWLATAPDLSRPSSALYISGKKSIGKSMLAQGVARLWHDGGPSLLENVIGHWNDDLTRCPLVWADEQLPTEWGKKAASTRLREVITADTRTLNRKFLPGASLKGCVRVVLTANNPSMLSLGDEDTTGADVEAFAARFLHIDAGSEVSPAADYLESLGGRNGTDGKAGTEGWVDGDMIAAHVLWLHKNRDVTLGNRLAVEGKSDEMARRLSMQSNLGSAVLEWLGRHIATRGSTVQGVIVGDGKILVSARAIVDSWEAHISAMRAPLLGKVQRVLAGPLSHGEVRVAAGGERPRYHSMKIEMVLQYAADCQIGDVDALRARIDAPTNTVALRA